MHVSDFMCERVGGTVFECGRDGQWKWWKEKECWSLKGASEGARASQCTVLNHMLSGSIDH